MKSFFIRGTNLKVPKLCVGTFQVSDKWSQKFDEKNFYKMLSICYKNSCTFIDTADSYQNGCIEKAIGNFLKKSKRNKWTIATKFGQLNGYGFNKVKYNLESSLKRLNSEYIDIYYFHSGTKKQFLNFKLWDYLNKQVDNGKIRYLAYSLSFNELKNFKKSDFQKLKDFNIKIVQAVYNPLFPIAKKILLKHAIENKIGIITRGTLAKGLLNKKSLELKNIDIKRFKHKKVNLSDSEFLKKTKYMRSNKLDPAHSTFREILKSKSIDSIICGVRNKEQLINNINFFKNYKNK